MSHNPAAPVTTMYSFFSNNHLLVLRNKSKKTQISNDVKIMLILTATIIINAFFLCQKIFIAAAVAVGCCAIAFMHGIKYYGVKNLLIFFIICWVVSNFFEGLSIHTGFPFGNYHHNIAGPRIWDVLIVIMPAYFEMGYFAWILSLVINNQYAKKLSGIKTFVVYVFMQIFDLYISKFDIKD